MIRLDSICVCETSRPEPIKLASLTVYICSLCKGRTSGPRLRAGDLSPSDSRKEPTPLSPGRLLGTSVQTTVVLSCLGLLAWRPVW